MVVKILKKYGPPKQKKGSKKMDPRLRRYLILHEWSLKDNNGAKKNLSREKSGTLSLKCASSVLLDIASPANGGHN